MKKNKFRLRISKSFLLLLISSFLFFIASCDFEDVSGPEPVDPPNPPDPDPPTDTTGTVPPDGILETVTWNIEWFGNESNGFGPSNEELQTDNAIRVLDSLKADLYAFEEINSQEALDNLTTRMKGYRGFVAEDQPRNQLTAFVFNTQTIDSVSSGLITEGQNSFDWASGRFPFFFSFNYTFEDTTVPFYAVVIHAKASDDQESYNRRMQAAESLHTYLTRNKPNANIIFLGDYNDDVDESIYSGATTPYLPFVDDEENFFVITKSLSQEGQSSTVSFPDIVDHITVSNELEPFYIFGSEGAFVPTDDFIDNYGNTTSDHYPVMARFDIRQ